MIIFSIFFRLVLDMIWFGVCSLICWNVLDYSWIKICKLLCSMISLVHTPLFCSVCYWQYSVLVLKVEKVICIVIKHECNTNKWLEELEVDFFLRHLDQVWILESSLLGGLYLNTTPGRNRTRCWCLHFSCRIPSWWSCFYWILIFVIFYSLSLFEFFSNWFIQISLLNSRF